MSSSFEDEATGHRKHQVTAVTSGAHPAAQGPPVAPPPAVPSLGSRVSPQPSVVLWALGPRAARQAAGGLGTLQWLWAGQGLGEGEQPQHSVRVPESQRNPVLCSGLLDGRCPELVQRGRWGPLECIPAKAGRRSRVHGLPQALSLGRTMPASGSLRLHLG